MTMTPPLDPRESKSPQRDAPTPCEPPKHRFDTDKRGYITADKCRCGKMPLRRAQ